ncbi:hypothetical protein [Pseudoxanthomonas japonensis]|uniref:hypothetical protein n=1 Tax=Pseudoxanthomonas japonensis TaxID=69284 RepID=UPI001BCC389F|nr:hypothetical protein [Pseudoxanthomonas japonensis]
MTTRRSRPGATPSNDASTSLFAALRNLLRSCTTELQVVHDEPLHFYANCDLPDAKGKRLFFGAVKVSNRKHLFHFMPVYDFPELLDGISPSLKKRMQGKSCFNFEALDPPLFSELEALVAQGVQRYKSAGKL